MKKEMLMWLKNPTRSGSGINNVIHMSYSFFIVQQLYPSCLPLGGVGLGSMEQ